MVETLFIGLSVGSILLLLALGLAITYGAMGVINMAHGELLMIGAYTAVLMKIYLGLGMLYAIPIAFCTSAGVGFVIEKFVVKRLYGRLLDTLLATWGISMLLQQFIRLEFGLAFFDIHIEGLGTGLQKAEIPLFLQSSIEIAGSTIPVFRAFIIVVALSLTAITWALIYRTSFGVQLRAVTKNADMAAACGIDVGRIYRYSFAYGSGLAGVAGVLLAGFKTVMPSMGTSYVIDGFLVVVVGGVGSLLGTFISAGFLGQLNVLFASYSNDIIARAAVFAAVILIILWRPKGLFSYKGR